MPMATGCAFSMLALSLFGPTIENFYTIKASYLMVNQYFIKPQKIYDNLSDSHPYLGPGFVFFLGLTVNLFVLNFFIAFLNEAYLAIITRIKILNYNKREKTKLEYAYEFLGITDTMNQDNEEENKFRDYAEQREFIEAMRRILGN
ncbi:hypothetical protein EGW08_004549 [Elysia chlorotica]|uniref:Polycystin cation channel PKD1/PKD2 domain-containing protein n=1 Tax=Elysia chlorotica TaxID=188477 RepID=A0A3S1ABP2_ELYCH|nr:hypothetical protein EGW08_004549 [Elysia chlorotica]